MLLVKILSIFAINALPLLGVLLWSWRVGDIIFLYWLENGVIGLINLLKISQARQPATQGIVITSNGVTTESRSAKAVAGFFTLHYGLFFIVHGVFVLILFPPAIDTLLEIAIAFGIMVCTHFYDYFVQYFKPQAYLSASPDKLMFAPYGRVLVVHLTILVGGLIAQSLGQPLWSLLVMVTLKILLDFGITFYRTNPITNAA